jgi:hypothetical protein
METVKQTQDATNSYAKKQVESVARHLRLLGYTDFAIKRKPDICDSASNGPVSEFLIMSNPKGFF